MGGVSCVYVLQLHECNNNNNNNTNVIIQHRYEIFRVCSREKEIIHAFDYLNFPTCSRYFLHRSEEILQKCRNT